MDNATDPEPTRAVRRFRPSQNISKLLFIYDVIAVTAAVVMALGIRLDTFDPTVSLIPFLPFALTPILVRPIVMVSFGLHRREWRYASFGEMLDLLNAVAIGSVIILVIYAVLSVLDVPSTSPFPRSFFVLEPLFFFLFAAGGRVLLRAVLERRAQRRRIDSHGTRVAHARLRRRQRRRDRGPDGLLGRVAGHPDRRLP